MPDDPGALVAEIDSRLEVAIYNALIGETDVGFDEVVEIARLFKRVINSLPTGGSDDALSASHESPSETRQQANL